MCILFLKYLRFNRFTKRFIASFPSAFRTNNIIYGETVAIRVITSVYETVKSRIARATMSSSGEFSTLSSGEATGTGDDSLPSSREATAEAASSGAGFMPLREFLDRFSLPRVVRVEGAGGRPILLYKQQQRSLRVTATLLMHRYRHDVKVGPEIVIPEGYPGESIGSFNFLFAFFFLLIDIARGRDKDRENTC